MTTAKRIRELIACYYSDVDAETFWIAACSDTEDAFREDQVDVSPDDGDTISASTTSNRTIPPRAR